MIYLAFGTKDKSTRQIEGPWDVFAVKTFQGGVGKPPYYKIIRDSGGDIEQIKLKEGTHDYNKVRKWVGLLPEGMMKSSKAAQHLVLSNNQRPSCLITERDIGRLV